MAIAVYTREESNRRFKIGKILFFFAFFILTVLVTVSVSSKFSNPQAQTIKKPVSFEPWVMGLYVRAPLVSTPVPVTPSPTPTPGKTAKKSAYVIAAYGDSMVDTMGNVLEYLEHSLKHSYPKTKFSLYNYGIGSQNVEDGLGRFGNGFDYGGRSYPPITQIKADIIIIGSFSYNPFSPHDPNRHISGLERLVQTAQTTGAHVYMLAEIAPLRKDFGKGPNGVNWDENTSHEHSGWILEQLRNTVSLSQRLKVPLINVFQKSLKNDSEGKSQYVNPSDGIHPSVEGHEFTADIITQTLLLD